MHLEKVANGAESQILQHNGRELSHHSNKNIDTKKTHLNYCLTEQDKPALQRFKDRLNECSYRKQKNNVRMESIVITAPKNLKAEDTALFFKVAHKALQELTGGKENEVGAWVHLDEKSPHMHYDFVPAIEINGVLKLSAKNLMNREKLSILHPTMQAAIDKAFGHHNYKVVADDPRDRQQSSDTIAVYKAKQEKLNQLDNSIKLVNEQQEDAYTSIMLTYQQKADIDKQIKVSEQTLNDTEQRIVVANETINMYQHNIDILTDRNNKKQAESNQLQKDIALLTDKAEKADLWLQTLNDSISQRGIELEEIEGKIERLEQYLKDNQYVSECVDLRHYIETEIEPSWLESVWNEIYGEQETVQQYSAWEDELDL